MRARPLPGIRIEPKAGTGRDMLPRMDIPVFIGFAASGPIDRPVPVSDPAQFAAIFGGDVALPAQHGAKTARTALLAPAVRAFFRHGGRRCWIIRVARTVPAPQAPAAVASSFAIPGLSRVAVSGSTSAANAVARSEGSWSDGFSVTASLVAAPLRMLAVSVSSPPSVDVAVRNSREVVAGDLVRVAWATSTPSLYLYVTAVLPVTPSPLPSGQVVRLIGRALWLPGATPLPALSPAPAPVAERLTFDLVVRKEREAPFVLRGLGFTPEHRRYFGALPSDAELFEDPSWFADGATAPFRPRRRIEFAQNFLLSENGPEGGWPELWREVLTPRFPLAVPRDGAIYVPSTMTALGVTATFVPSALGTPIERDGLAQFDRSLFIDRAFFDVRVRDVLDRADAIRYRGNAPRSLTGMHAALSVDEATIVAIPDAAHAGWDPDAAPPLQSPPASSPLLHPEWWRWLDCRSPLSVPPETPPGAGFIACELVDPIPAPVLTKDGPFGGRFELKWDEFPGSLDELEEATSADFAGAAVISRGAPGFLTVYGRPAGDYFYRVRRIVGGRTSDYSNGVAVRIAPVSGFVERSSFDDAHLMDIHRALLRMCAARADWSAVLSLPRTYDERAALAHVAGLATTEDSRTLSFGALWHPWLIGRDEASGDLRAVPPDGAMTGVMALRAIRRGAWVAPANEPLQDVVDLTPRLGTAWLQALQDSAINVVRQEPFGFVALDADTLTGDETVRALSVRRLLILIRRFALRVGNDYVFEPNGGPARRAVKRAFELMLETLFLRGAFAGRTARSAFQVVTDETVNAPGTVDRGQLMAEIRVAPSRPLSFLTIRLLRSGDVTSLEEIA